MSETWPREITGAKPDGTPGHLTVTRAAVLKTLLLRPDSGSVQTLLSWLVFSFGALLQGPPFVVNLSVADRQAWIGLLRQLADRLESAESKPLTLEELGA